MNVPRFTAEAAVYKTRGSYRTVGTGALITAQVVPQLTNLRPIGGWDPCRAACNLCKDSHTSAPGVCLLCALCS